MKKLSTMLIVAAMAAITMAQSVTTHSVYDVNQNGGINVADAVSVAQATLQSVEPGLTQQTVTAEELNDVLGNIYQTLGKLDQKLNYIMEESGISNPFEPDENGIFNNGHEYVDLGVVIDGKPMYWATTNIGAELPADYGLYFAWGETVGYGLSPQGIIEEDAIEIRDGREFNLPSYSSDLCGGDWSKMKKYCTDSIYGTVDNKTVLDPEDDAAHMNWQGSWRMPTREEQEALLTQCTWTWTMMTNSAGESIKGYKVANKNDSSKYIFLPAAGYRDNSYLISADQDDYYDQYGCYWSSSLGSNNNYACHLGLHSYWKSMRTEVRYLGHSVRPVCQ